MKVSRRKNSSSTLRVILHFHFSPSGCHTWWFHFVALGSSPPSKKWHYIWISLIWKPKIYAEAKKHQATKYVNDQSSMLPGPITLVSDLSLDHNLAAVDHGDSEQDMPSQPQKPASCSSSSFCSNILCFRMGENVSVERWRKCFSRYCTWCSCMRTRVLVPAPMNKPGGYGSLSIMPVWQRQEQGITIASWLVRLAEKMRDPTSTFSEESDLGRHTMSWASTYMQMYTHAPAHTSILRNTHMRICIHTIENLN